MSIYFKKDLTLDLIQYFDNKNVPAHEKIGAIFRNAIAEIKQPLQEHLPNLLGHLGVHPKDENAIDQLTQLLQTLEDDSLKITSTQNTGIYFIQKQKASAKNEKLRFENVAVFKIGRKRAAIETAARFLAHTLKLDRQMIPGMFCALLDPPLSADEEGNSSCEEEPEETVEELWNGMEKVYCQLPTQTTKEYFNEELDADCPFAFEGDDGESLAPIEWSSEEEDEIEKLGKSPLVEGLNSGKTEDENKSEYCSSEEESFSKENVERTSCAVVGIVQPFLAHREDASVYEYTLMTMLALAIGLRDGKKDGYKGSMLFDVEDSFPIRMDPVWKVGYIEKSASAIDLPYLDQDPRTTAALTHEEVGQLVVIVQNWKISQTINALKHLRIRYEDKAAENMQENSKATDDGGCPVEILKAEPHLINGNLNHLDPSNTKRRVFMPEQLDACSLRLQRMRDFIIACAMHQETFTPQDLVDAVDKWGKIYKEALRRSPILPQVIDRIYSAQGSYHITGRNSPEEAQVIIEPSEYSSHIISPSPSELMTQLEGATNEMALCETSPSNISD